MKVQDVMTTTVVTATPDTSFPELVDRLLEYGVSGLPIVDDERRLVGIVTEADLVSKEAFGGRRRRRVLGVLADRVHGDEAWWKVKAKGRTAADIMTTGVRTAGPRDDVRTVARRMLELGVKRFPVVDDGSLVGIISRTDLLRLLHRSDDDLRRHIETVLADPMQTPEHHAVQVTVRGGVVELQGTVRFPMDVPVLTALVWQVPGVVAVHNEVTGRERDPVTSWGR